MSPRPDRLVVVAGTGTEIGKTWVGGAVLQAAREAGMTVAARKPAQSFDPDDALTDADHLAAATGESPTEVCPSHRWYRVALAPPMAADVLGSGPIAVDDLAGEIEWPDGVDLGVVETAGGVRSPMAHDGDGVSLCRLVAPDAVLLVADAGLGTLNDVRLSVAALSDAIDVASVVVHLNRFDDSVDLHGRNRRWLTEVDGFIVTTTLAELLPAIVPTSPPA